MRQQGESIEQMLHFYLVPLAASHKYNQLFSHLRKLFKVLSSFFHLSEVPCDTAECRDVFVYDFQ